MSLTVIKRNEIQDFIIYEIGNSEIYGQFKISSVIEKYKVSEQTVYRYLRQLAKQGRIIRTAQKSASNRYDYSLPDRQISFTLPLIGMKEDIIWKERVAPELKKMPTVAKENCYYAFTEMLNNAIDHSEGSLVKVDVRANDVRTFITIADDGIGIFNKIADSLGLEEKRYAVLELAKGKFTTDPRSHTGEGIFFSSKVTDLFAIASDEITFMTDVLYSEENPIFSEFLVDIHNEWKGEGTTVIFVVFNDRVKTIKEVFDEYTEQPDGYGFDKTSFSVKLLEYGDETALFMSRSQAKRLLSRIDRFKRIILDFSGIDTIGQGFADEIFRVFINEHPDCVLTPINCSTDVEKMISRVSI